MWVGTIRGLWRISGNIKVGDMDGMESGEE